MGADELAQGSVSVDGADATISFVEESSAQLLDEWWSGVGQDAFTRWMRTKTGEVTRETFGE